MSVRISFCVAVLFLLFPPVTAKAWMSGDESQRGPARAQIVHRATEPNNEHGLLFRQTLTFAGIPTEMTAEFDLSYWTNSGGYPAPLTEIDRTDTRSYILEGMSALPDHSYSLWDWASGNLTCPVGTPAGAAERCHMGVGHLGIVGSSHYLPQAQTTYVYYHDLAVSRARQCGSLADQLDAGSVDSGLDADAFIQECEREALLLEAFGQHFLQDAWAVGHMWQRWGSSDIRQYPDEEVAEAVALGAKLIHGVGLGEPDDLSSDLSDLTISVAGRTAGATGDLQVADLNDDAKYTNQRNRLFRCAAAGVREVYGETAMRSGGMDPYSGPGALMSSERLRGDDCFGQRVTNGSILSGVGLSGQSAAKQALLIGATDLVNPSGSELEELAEPFRYELLRLQAIDWLSGQFDDAETLRATTYANGAEPFDSFMGVAANEAFNEVAPYLDPALPADDWPIASGEQAGARQGGVDSRPSRVLARVFNQAHLVGWCDDAEARPDGLRDQFLAAPSAARRQLCEEFTARHVRPVGGQSLCEAVGRGAYTLVATGGQTVTQAAALFCDPPPPPLEITAELDTGGSRVARGEVDFAGGGNGNRTRIDAADLPVDISIEESEADFRMAVDIASDYSITNSGVSATISGNMSARLELDREVLAPEADGEAAGDLEWSVLISVSQPADYQLSANLSGGTSGLLFECVGAIGIELSGDDTGVLQEFYAAGCGDNYPASVSDVVQGTLAPGNYTLTVTSDTPLDSDWELSGSLFSPVLTIGSDFELQIVEEGEDFN